MKYLNGFVTHNNTTIFLHKVNLTGKFFLRNKAWIFFGIYNHTRIVNKIVPKIDLKIVQNLTNINKSLFTKRTHLMFSQILVDKSELSICGNFLESCLCEAVTASTVN